MKKIYTAIAVWGVALQSMGQFCIYKDGKAVYVMRGERPDYVTFEKPVVEQTESGLEYLNDYSCLRDYVADNGLKLGVDVDPVSFVDGGKAYVAACLNFNELSAADAITMRDCVDNYGMMNFKQFKRFVRKAKLSGLSVFGGTLVSCTKQPTEWLYSHIVEKDEGGGEIIKISRETYEKRNCFKVSSLDMIENPWESQMWFVTDGFKAGDEFELTVDVMASNKGRLRTEIHDEPGQYVDYYAIGEIDFDTNWNRIVRKGIFYSDGKTIALNLNAIEKATVFYLDNVSLTVNGVEQIKNGDAEDGDATNDCILVREAPANGSDPIRMVDRVVHQEVTYSVPTPLSTDKIDALKGVMQKWVSGLMSVTQGSVKAWDVISEPLSDVDEDEDGWYDIAHTSDKYKDGLFSWPDYLGDVEYARTAVEMAREEFVNAGGNAEELQLFVNECGLENVLDGVKRLSSLLHWIDEWESDGVTHIDGIGAEMLLVFYADVDKQKAQEEAIVNTFQTLAESGKLIRLSGLNMRYVDAGGMYVLSSDVSDEQMTEMAGYYEFVIKKYMDIIPQSQRYGIAFDGLTDNNSNRTVGLWNDEFQRSRVFGAVAEVLGQ